MLRLDHNRALVQIAQKLSQPITKISRLTVWGNHSNTQYPDLNHALVGNDKVISRINDAAWVDDYFVPTVQNRGMAIISARDGKSSAASAANAIINHVHDWVFGTKENDWTSMGIPSDGSYGIPEGVIYSFPVICQSGNYQIVQGLEINETSQQRMNASYHELITEREAIKHLLG